MNPKPPPPEKHKTYKEGIIPTMRGGVPLRDTDIICFPDWEELERLCTPDTQPKEFQYLRAYVGDVINLSDRQRIIVLSLVVCSPPIPIRRIAKAMRIPPADVRRYYEDAREKFRRAPLNVELPSTPSGAR